MRYRVVSITTEIEHYPESVKDTMDFPHLVKHVFDEQTLFVVRLGTDDFWHADEFFAIEDLKEFSTDEEYNF